MTRAEGLCRLTAGRVELHLKLLNHQKSKVRDAVNVDRTSSTKCQVRRLQGTLDMLRMDYAALDGLPDKLSALVDEWILRMARIEDEASRDAARQQYLELLPETEWQTNIAAECDEVLRQLATSIRVCEETIPALTEKLTTEERARVDEFLTPPRVPRALPPSSLQPHASPPQDARPPFSPTSFIYVTPKSRSTASHDRTTREKASFPAHNAGSSLQARSGLADPPAHNAGGLPPAQSGASQESNNREKACFPAHNAGSSLQACSGRADPPAHNAGGLPPAQSGASTSDGKRLTKHPSVDPKKLPRAGLGYYTDESRKSANSSATTPAGAGGQEPGNVAAAAVPSLKQLSISDDRRSPCAFCHHHGHRSTHCLNYGTLEKRLLRAARTCICVSCCSTQPEPHLWKACPHEPLACNFCKLRGHHQAYCRSWLRIFSNRISRRRPQTNTRKTPTSLRSRSTNAKPSSQKAKNEPCRQLRCTCQREDCVYVIPLPWKVTDAPATRATQTLNVASSLDYKAHDAASEPHPRPPPSKPPAAVRTGWSSARGGARSSPPRPAAHNAAGTAASSGLAAHNAAGNLYGRGTGAADSSHQSRSAADRLKATMCSETTSDYDPCGHCRSCSGPLEVGADGKPFSGTTNVVPPDFDVAPACHVKSRPMLVRGFSKHSYIARVIRQAQKQRRLLENRTRGRSTDVKNNADTPEIDSDDPVGPNPPLSTAEQRALDAALDSDNESCAYEAEYRNDGYSFATTPYARRLSPSGGFGPVTEHEFGAHGDFATTAEEEYDWPNEPTSTATLTPSRTWSSHAREPELHHDPGTSAQQTSRVTVYEDHSYGDDLYEDRHRETNLYEGDFHGGDFDDYDSVY